MIGSRTQGALALRAAEMGAISLRCQWPADSVLAMVLADVAYLAEHTTEDHSLELAIALGREVIDWAKRHYGAGDLVRLVELLEFVIASEETTHE